jgi:AcrR family transcriptional regulator
MSPRPYRSESRQSSTDQTRARIVAAARELLASETGSAGFTLDAVARNAGVVRMTVYYQFRSKSGLLEAVYDDIALRGGISGMREAFSESDPWCALRGIVDVLAHMYEGARSEIKRLHGLAALDEEIERGLRARNDRRREVVRAIVERLREDGSALALPEEDARAVLMMLTSFESFDALAGEGRSIASVLPIAQRLVARALRQA